MEVKTEDNPQRIGVGVWVIIRPDGKYHFTGVFRIHDVFHDNQEFSAGFFRFRISDLKVTWDFADEKVLKEVSYQEGLFKGRQDLSSNFV